MYSKYQWRLLILIVVVVAISASLSLNISASEIEVLDGAVSITDTQNTVKNSSGIVTATAKGGLLSKKDNTITIKNNSGDKAKISFEYIVTSANSFKIDGNSAEAKGSYSKEVDAGGTIVLYIQSKSGFSDLTVTLQMSDFACEAIAESSTVTFEFDSALGNVTVDGEAIVSGTKKENVAYGTSLTLNASPKSGVTFLGWVDTTNSNYRESKNASFGYSPQKDTTLKAIFINTASAPWFLVSNSYLIDDLNKAATLASTKIDKTVALMNTTTLPAGDYTIPSGVTLLIPFDDAHTLYTTTPKTTGSTYTKPTVYRKLTMAQGANITVNGAISVSAKHRSGSGGATGTGAPSGPCGFVQMNEGSSITLNNGSALYAYGFITGSGTVTAKNGSIVYECFQIQDFRGGDQTTNMKNEVFAVSQYYIQNIETSLVLEAGAKEYGYTSATVTLLGDMGSSCLVFGSTDDAMFKIVSGSITKCYNGATDRLHFVINGEIEVGYTELKISLYTLNTKNYILMLNNNMDITVQSGQVTIREDIAFTPGITVNVVESAKLILGTSSQSARMYVYDADVWQGFCGAGNKTFIPINYAPGKTYTRTEADLKDVEIFVNGTLDSTYGTIYTTSGGANIHSTGNGKVIIKNIGSETVTYQVKQAADVKNSTYVEIPIKPAYLKNNTTVSGMDIEYVKTGLHGSATYEYVNGHWHLEDCDGQFDTTVTDATCVQAGSELKSCSCYVLATEPPCDCHGLIEELPILSHVEGDWIRTEDGFYEECLCSLCQEYKFAKRLYSTLDLDYRLNDYIWMNAVVTIPAEGVAQLVNDYDGTIELVQGNGGTYYLVRKVLSTDLTSEFKVKLSIGEYQTQEFVLSFTTFANELIDKEDKHAPLVQAMLNYGKAAKVYFSRGTVADDAVLDLPAGLDTSLSKHANGAATNLNGFSISTAGVEFTFNEQIGMTLHMVLKKDGTATTFSNLANVVQVGVLVGDASNGSLLSTNETTGYYDAAYILYQSGGLSVANPSYPDIPEGTDFTTDNIATKDSLDEISECTISFDLKSAEYAKTFSLRLYIVVDNTPDDATDNDFSVIYGTQYHYGLGNYIARTYNSEYATLPDGYDMNAYKNFMVATWYYKEAAVAAFGSET